METRTPTSQAHRSSIAAPEWRSITQRSTTAHQARRTAAWCDSSRHSHAAAGCTARTDCVCTWMTTITLVALVLSSPFAAERAFVGLTQLMALLVWPVVLMLLRCGCWASHALLPVLLLFLLLQFVPTCKDTDLTTSGQQRWPCNSAQGWITNPAADNFQNPSNEVCCAKVNTSTCADYLPYTAGVQAWPCPYGTVPDPNKQSYSPPDNGACCLVSARCWRVVA